ncbi:MAG: Ig-like domain-containing protein, partial [Gordonia amarae]
MRISHKNRARLIAAAAGVSLFLNPGHAAADDDTGSPSGTSSQSGSGGGADSSSGNPSSGDSSSGDSQSPSSSADSDSSGGSDAPSGSGSGSGSDTGGDASTDSGADDNPSSGDDGSAGAPDSDTSDGGTPAGTDNTTGSADTSGTPTETTAPSGDNPDIGTAQPDNSTGGPDSGGTQQETQGAPDPDSGQPWTAPPSSPSTDFTGPDPTTPDTNSAGTDPDTTNPTTGPDGTDASTTGTESTETTEPETGAPQILGFTAPSTPDDTETSDDPQTFNNAAFFAPTAPTTPPAGNTTTPLTTLLTFLGIPQTGGPTTPTTFTTSPAPWTLLWWIQRTQSLLNNQTPNAAPTLTPTTDGYTISLGATDPDGDPLTTTITAGPTNGTATVNPDGTITYTANPGSTAADQITVAVSDNGPHIHGLTSLLGLFTGQNPHNRTVTINIPESTTAPTNQPPVVNPSQTATVGTPDTITGAVIVTGLTSIVTDPDGDPITFTSTDTNVVFDTTNPGTFTWTPTTGIRHDAAVPGAPQTHTVTITADDGNGGTVDITVVVPIDPVNSAPRTVPGQSATITNVNLSTGQIDGTIAGIHTDPDGDALVYATTTPGATINSAGAFTYIPDAQTRHDAAAPGGPQTTTITVTIDDGHGGTTSYNVEVPVVSDNANPTTVPGQSASITNIDTTTGHVDGTIAGVHTDPDGDALTYSTTTPGATINPDGTFTWTPDAQTRHDAAVPGAPQTTAIAVSIDDGHGGTTTYDIEVPIVPQNGNPAVVPGQAPTIDYVNPTTGQVVGSVLYTFADPDGDFLSYTTATPGATVTPWATFTYTPTDEARHDAAVPGAPHTTTITISIDDGHGGTTSYDITVPITPHNTTPGIIPGQTAAITNIDSTTGQVNGTIAGLYSDPDNDTLTYTTTTPHVTINPDGTFTYTPTTQTRHDAAVPGAPHTTTITISIDDGHGGTTTYDVEVPIVPQNAAPTVTVSAPSAPRIDSGVVTGSLTATDTDTDTLTFTVSGATSSGTNTFTTANGGTLSINPATGTYTYIPSGAQRWAASYINATTDDTTETITITVDDGHGGVLNKTITIPIGGMTLPGVAPFGVQIAPDGTAYQTTWTGNSTTGYTYYVTAITPTGTTTTTTLTGNPSGSVHIAPDGTAYQTTRTGNSTTGYTYYVTAITPTGTTTTT